MCPEQTMSIDTLAEINLPPKGLLVVVFIILVIFLIVTNIRKSKIR